MVKRNIDNPAWEIVTRYHNKDNQRDAIIIEAIVWAFVLGVAYMIAKAIF